MNSTENLLLAELTGIATTLQCATAVHQLQLPDLTITQIDEIINTISSHVNERVDLAWKFPIQVERLEQIEADVVTARYQLVKMAV